MDAMVKWLFGDKQPEPTGSRVDMSKKLKDFLDLATEALSRAQKAEKKASESKSATAPAVKLYKKVVEIVHSALAVHVPETTAAITKTRKALNDMQLHANDRLRALQPGKTLERAYSNPPSGAAARKAVGARSGSVGAGAEAKKRRDAIANSRGQRPADGMEAIRMLGDYAAVAAGGQPSRAAPAPAPVAAAAVPRPQVPQRSRPPPPAAPAPAARLPPITKSGPSRPGGASRPGGEDSVPPELRQMIMSQVLDRSLPVSWDSIAGLAVAKQALQEAVVLPALRPDLYTGLRSPVRGILLYGPPGNGKTMLGKALASEAKATFFSISASTLTSKLFGDSEKLVRALFSIAAEMQPAIIFIDEIDSVLSARSSGEHDAMRRLKTEFLVQFDGVASGADRTVVIGATNRPQELDDAVRRRLVKRIYIPLPDDAGRRSAIETLLKGQPSRLTPSDIDRIVRATAGYSGSDLNALCKEAAMAPIRDVPPGALVNLPASKIRQVEVKDFLKAQEVIKPSVDRGQLKGYEEFTKAFGTS